METLIQQRLARLRLIANGVNPELVKSIVQISQPNIWESNLTTLVAQNPLNVK